MLFKRTTFYRFWSSFHDKNLDLSFCRVDNFFGMTFFPKIIDHSKINQECRITMKRKQASKIVNYFSFSKMTTKSDLLSEGTICTERLETEQDIIKLPCQHSFHYDCARFWLTQFNQTCPNCRKKVPRSEPVMECDEAFIERLLHIKELTSTTQLHVPTIQRMLQPMRDILHDTTI